MRNTKKAFTLVELIVVITILAILATVAFVSLGGQTDNARNTVKKDAISKLATAVDNAKVNGISMLAFAADNVNNLTAGNIGGQDVVTLSGSNTYKAGKINYTALDVNKDDFMDTALNNEYRVGVTTLNGGKFQFAATLKDDAGLTAYIAWNYSPRPIEALAWTIANWEKNFTLTNATDIKKLVKGDTVVITWEPAGTTFVIKAVSPDYMQLTLDNPVTADRTEISLNKLAAETTEVAGLISDKTVHSVPVTATGTGTAY